MPHPMGSHLGMGAGIGIDSTAACWRRYYGIGGYVHRNTVIVGSFVSWADSYSMYTGYPLGFRLPGKMTMGMGGYYGVSNASPARPLYNAELMTTQGWDIRD